MNAPKSTSVIGILAHVDAGKTTLAEALLYVSGARRTQGRVDHGDTVMDSHELERERGITIFSSEAVIEAGGRRFALLDTPGHVDFSAEMERTLKVLDAAVLVLSGTDGVQAHTRTLWRLLSLYRIPTFIFVTKMDYARHTEAELMKNLAEELGDSVVNFCAPAEARDEQAAMQSEEALQEFLDAGSLSNATLIRMIAGRLLFPVWFGSGLKLTGVQTFLDGLTRYVPEKTWPDAFGARVFKISADEDGSRLTHLKVTGSVLRVRDSVSENEKVSQLRIYTGEKYVPVDEVPAGMICVAAGLRGIPDGAGLGYEDSGTKPVLSPVMRYTIVLPEGTDAREVLPSFKRLEAEDPLLEITWDPWLKEIQVALMGEVQAEILKSIVHERFGLDIEITRGHVLYRETILNKVEGVGHYEPLRHYAEVHLLLEPAPRGSGLIFASNVSTNVLDRNWQNLILQHLAEKQHLGVLTGSPLTDVRITLAAGRAHLKHTEGGDFRQATYRAVRQGLMRAKSALLEPWYRFRIEVPVNLLSRVMTDIKAKSGTFLPPVYAGDSGVLTGRAPCIEMSDYAKTLASCSGGLGRLLLEYDGYDRCHNEAAVLAGVHYDPEADTENSPDSVFCAHGAGFLVKWRDVPRYMHLPSCLKNDLSSPAALRRVRAREHVPEDELEAIMLREFGPIRRPQYREARVYEAAEKTVREEASDKKQILIVDGYNVIFQWDDLRALAESDIHAARTALLQILSNFSAFRAIDTIVIFDGYKVPGSIGELGSYHNLRVIYTRENESGDLYIERLVGALKKNEQAQVVTSDALIQLSALRAGLQRISSAEFEEIVAEAQAEISKILARSREANKSTVGEILKDIEAKEEA